MAKKELIWKEIAPPEGDYDIFSLKGRKYQITGTLKEDPDYGECKQLCRVSHLDSSEKDEFAVIVSFIRIENGSFIPKRAILSEPVHDIGSAIDIFESARC
ncbi:hypothetical protein M1439_03505 [Candidatus Marsarchaeota archaeon]|jgi:NADH:ubiquinone oxidoreductase subunit C|nr:hypothetical protein [Candidatus Marsarchaeota archaeon]MCL5092363.1 hypothetical protein [Candidatus Marsarchaeota archaeon]